MFIGRPKICYSFRAHQHVSLSLLFSRELFIGMRSLTFCIWILGFLRVRSDFFNFFSGNTSLPPNDSCICNEGQRIFHKSWPSDWPVVFWTNGDQIARATVLASYGRSNYFRDRLFVYFSLDLVKFI